MFTCGLDETKFNFTKIEDCEPDIFEPLFGFIYEGKTPEDLRLVSIHLYELAHRYDIPRLTQICLDDIMKIQINSLNCLEIYQFAIMYKLNHLMYKTWRYIKK